MRINNNIAAMNTHRQYGVNNGQISKSTEKLSSGFRINRAGDDAAGLAISEKMRAQIRGLQMASKNSQDAISLLQTAEGALQETHNMLQRMRELGVQSASDSNETCIDRAALQAEFAQLMQEIDDTANKTKFNDMGIIDGSLGKKDAAAKSAALKNAAIAAFANPSSRATVATGPITVATGYNTADQYWNNTVGNNSSFTNGSGESLSAGLLNNFVNDLEFLGETPDDITPRAGFANGVLTFSHGAVNGTFDIGYTIEKLDASGNKLGEYTWKATVNSSATSVEMEYNGGFKNHAGGGSTFKFDLTQSSGTAISVGAWATADDLGGGNRGGALGAWGSDKTATCRFLTGLTNQGAGSPIGTTYAGTPARPGSEVYNTVDTVTFMNSPFSRDANGNTISAANRLVFSGLSGELPLYYASALGRNVSCDVNISHSPENGKFLISIIAAGVEWNAHVDGNSTSFELINAGGPTGGGSSIAFSTPNGQTLSEWASAIGAMGAPGGGKTITGSASATFTE